MDRNDSIFEAADAVFRPEMRWWLAEGSHTERTIKKSVQELYNAGFGSVELITRTDPSLDLERYGWDSRAFYETCLIAAKEATRLGMGISFTSGPNWYTAVPGITPDDNAAAQELGFTWMPVEPGGLFDGEIETKTVHPKAKKHPLVRVIAGKIVGEYRFKDGDPGRSGPTALDEASLTDLTALAVQSERGVKLRWTAPDDGQYLIFVFWMEGTGQIATASFRPAFVVNHYSSDGARAVAEYWDRHIFTREMLEVLRQNRCVEFFEDSIEMGTGRGSALFWSETMLEDFRCLRGYDISLYLPVLIRLRQRFVTGLNAPIFELAGNREKTLKIWDDMALAYSALYETKYIGTLSAWLHGHGILYRAQPVYGQWQDQALAARAPDRPELETLYFHDEPDAYKLQTGVMHIYGKSLISCELGAIFGRVYHVDVREYLRSMNLAFASGMNRMIFHGCCSDAGPEGNLKWPGYDGLENGWSDRWGPRMPIWGMIRELTDYVARCQKILRKGKPRIDVGIIGQCFWMPEQTAPQRAETDTFWKGLSALTQMGYSYEYVTPEILPDRDAVYVDNGTLSPEGPGYKALVVWQPALSAAAAEALLELARASLKVVVVTGGGVRSSVNDGGDAQVRRAMSSLRSLPNVCCVPRKADVPSGLAIIGARPRVELNGTARIMTALREEDGARWVFAYNCTDTFQSTTARISGRCMVYHVDLWSGSVVRLGKQRWGTSGSDFAIELEPECSAAYLIRESAEEPEWICGPAAREVIRPEGWTLSVEKWMPGRKHLIAEDRGGEHFEEWIFETKKETVTVSLRDLDTWDNIPEIGRGASGVGVYSAYFELPDKLKAADRVTVDLGRYLGMAQVWVNGKKCPPIDQTMAKADITDFTQPGQNKLQIVLASLLGNAAIDSGAITPGPVPSNFRGNTYRNGALDHVDYRRYGLSEVTVELFYSR